MIALEHAVEEGAVDRAPAIGVSGPSPPTSLAVIDPYAEFINYDAPRHKVTTPPPGLLATDGSSPGENLITTPREQPRTLPTLGGALDPADVQRVLEDVKKGKAWDLIPDEAHAPPPFATVPDH